jgi:hypothetical protein
MVVEVLPSGSNSAANVTFKQAGSSTQRTVQAKLEESVSVKDFGAVGDGVTDDTLAIQAAEYACAISGQSLWFPSGTYRCDSGITKKAVNWNGSGKYKTVLNYKGSGTFINATGTPSDRVICTISDMTLDGTGAAATAIGLTMGWNMRSLPFLNRVRVYNFGHYGIYFDDQNWIVSFTDVEIELCGITTVNSSGIYKDPAVDASTWNAIVFNNLVVEACGSSTSTSGGVYLPTTTANRGLYFNDCTIEGNRGSAEIFINNNADVQFNNLYIERTNVAGQLNAVEFDNCTGSFQGGYITGEDGINEVGLKLTNSQVHIEALTTERWTVAGVRSFGSIVSTDRNYNIAYNSGDGSAQWFGSYAPRMHVNKGGSNQTGIISGVFTKVTFGNEVYDLTGGFSGNTFTPQSIGIYQIDCNINWVSAVDQDRLILAVYVNGFAQEYTYVSASGTGQQSIRISTQTRTTAVTDYIEIYARQDSGSTKDISGVNQDTWFMASLIGRSI